MRPVIYPYKIGSGSAKRLAELVASKIGKKVSRVRSDSRTFVPKNFHKVFNWGSNTVPVWGARLTWLNKPDAVGVAQDKLKTFQKFAADANMNGLFPEWTTDRAVAQAWLANKVVVVARTILRGHSGNGIVIVEHGEELPNAPLFVAYKKKKQEFRVHVFNGQVIDVQEKRREREVERDEDQQRIRNRHNGWVFARENIVEPNTLRDSAIRAVAALELDFGAVDIIYNAKENKCYVLEVNTAPGIEGTTLENYANAIVAAL